MLAVDRTVAIIVVLEKLNNGVEDHHFVDVNGTIQSH